MLRNVMTWRINGKIRCDYAMERLCLRLSNPVMEDVVVFVYDTCRAAFRNTTVNFVRYKAG